jgi:hypothetical protein
MIYLNRTLEAMRTNIQTTAKRPLTTAEKAMKSGMLLMQEALNETFVKMEAVLVERAKGEHL